MSQEVISENPEDGVEKQLDNLSPDEEKMVRLAVSRSFCGPLPPPQMLKEYGEIIPDAPERILRMAEKEQASEIEHRKSYALYRLRGQFFALCITFGFMIFGGIIIYLGHPLTGVLFSGTGLVTIVCAFIYGQRHNKGQPENT